jgi:TPR repeat protein
VSAAKDYKLAADQNLAEAQFRYGMCLHRGQGVTIDLIEGAEYLRLAADRGHGLARLNYGSCLYYGWVFPKISRKLSGISEVRWIRILPLQNVGMHIAFPFVVAFEKIWSELQSFTSVQLIKLMLLAN